MSLLFGSLIGFGLAVGLTVVMKKLAVAWNIMDDPARAPARKMQKHAVPQLGGVAIILASLITWALAGWLFPEQNLLPNKLMLGLTISGLLILIGGALDDTFHLKPLQQLAWAVPAALVAIAFGVGVDFITNPFGGLIYLDQVNIKVLEWNGVPYYFTLWADLFSFVWLLGMMYTTKVLDGLDGLVSGVGVIGSIVVFLLTLRPEVDQPGLGFVALVFGASCLGFLLFNWNPAKIFLGESGALFVGFMLGVMAIISGGKIATALLIMGLPILDLAWVIIQRRLGANLSPYKTADRRHLHFKLVDAGLSVRSSVLLLYGVTLLFGLSTLWFSRPTKILVLGALGVVLVCLAIWVTRRIAKRSGIKTV